MKRVTLGDCGLRVSELVFGTLSMGRLQSQLPVEEGARVIVRGVELGIDCIDTAQSYATYEHVALALRQLGRDGDGVSIIGKSHAHAAKDMQDAVDEARRVLKREVIDGFHMHAITSVKDFEDRRGAFETLVRLKSEGVIRAIGFSVHSLEGLEPAYDCDEIDMVMPCVNSKGMGIKDGTLDQMLSACRRLKAKGKGVYAMKPLAGGHLYDSVVESINFVRGLREVDAVALGMKNIPELEMNLAVFEDRPVPEELRAQVHTRARQLLIYPTCEGCASCIKHCLQDALTLVDGKAVVDMNRCILCGYCAEECSTLSIRVV